MRGSLYFYIASEQYLVEMGKAVERILADGGHSVAEHNSRDQIGVAAPGEVLSVVVGIHVAAALDSYLEEVGLQAPCEVISANAARLAVVIDNLDILERRGNVGDVYLFPVAFAAAVIYRVYLARAAERTGLYFLYALAENDRPEIFAYREYVLEGIYLSLNSKCVSGVLSKLCLPSIRQSRGDRSLSWRSQRMPQNLSS